MKSTNRLALSVIRTNLEAWGFPLTDDQFNSLTIKDLNRIHRKAQKVRKLTNDIYADVEACVMDEMERE